MEVDTPEEMIAEGTIPEDKPYYSSLSNFVIEKKIGRGQFSVVYRARCTVDGAIVALKKVQVRHSWPCHVLLWRDRV